MFGSFIDPATDAFVTWLAVGFAALILLTGILWSRLFRRERPINESQNVPEGHGDEGGFPVHLWDETRDAAPKRRHRAF